MVKTKRSPKDSGFVPSYCVRADGQAFVSPNGRRGPRIYLGKDGPAARAEYDRVIAEWMANGRSLPAKPAQGEDLSVEDVMGEYWGHAQRFYVKGGAPTGHAERVVRYAIRPVRTLYGHVA